MAKERSGDTQEQIDKCLTCDKSACTHAFIDSTQIRAPETHTEEDICEFMAMYGPMVLGMAADVFKELQKQKQ